MTTSVYDIPKNLLALLGSLWASAYSGREQVEDYVRGKCQLEQQSMTNVLETIASVSRRNIPVWHREHWFPIRLLESQKNLTDAAVIRYDTGYDYDTGYTYDVPVAANDFIFPKPARLAAARILVDRFVSPSLTLFSGVDYRLTDAAIVFQSDPFARGLPTQTLYDDRGEPADRELVLWAYGGDLDWDYVYRQFGYALAMRMRSSDGYKAVMNAVFEALLRGSSAETLRFAISAITGIPLVREAEEVVEAIEADARGQLVITNRHVYRFSLSAVATVAVGDTVRRGDTLTDAIQIVVPRRGEVPSNIRCLSFDKGMLATCFHNNLIFENRDVPLNVITDDPSGYTKLTWQIGGDPRDVERFFDELHARGVATAASGEPNMCEGEPLIVVPGDNCDTETSARKLGTLAHRLDRRENRVGEPGPDNLPRTINPLKFIAGNLLRHHAAIVQIKAGQSGYGVGVHNLRLLSRLVPPRAALFLLLDATVPQDSAPAESVTEAMEFCYALAPMSDSVSTSMVSDGYPVMRAAN